MYCARYKPSAVSPVGYHALSVQLSEIDCDDCEHEINKTRKYLSYYNKVSQIGKVIFRHCLDQLTIVISAALT